MPVRAAPHARPLLTVSALSPSVKPQLASQRTMAYAPTRNSRIGVTIRIEIETGAGLTSDCIGSFDLSLKCQTGAFRPKRASRARAQKPAHRAEENHSWPPGTRACCGLTAPAG